MKRFLALASLVLGLASCQKDTAGFDVTVGGEQEVMVNVSLAEATRATSADSGIQNVNNSVYDLRYILEVYDTNGNEFVYRDVKTVETDVKSVSFPVRLIPERNYNFVVWADFVTNNSTDDLYYTTTNGLDEVAIITAKWVQMDEARDAYTGQANVTGYNSGKSINIPLTRPFGKLRVVTTDIDALKKLNGTPMPKAITVAYTNEVYTAFNALVQSPNTEVSKSYTYDLVNVYGEDWVSSDSRTLFTDYIFGTESGSIQFTMNVTMTNDNVVSNNFNTEIPVKRNYLTTIKGNILTDGNDIKVDVTDDFENAGGTNPDYDYSTISSDAEFLAALNAGGKFVVISDIHIKSNNITPGLLSTRAGEATGKVSTINLNGYTITVTNKTTAPFATVAAGNTLFLEGGNIVLAEDSTASFIKNEGNVVLSNGTLENESNHNTAAVVEGKVIVEENATVNDNNTTEVTNSNWLTDVLTNGGTYVFTADMTIEKSPMKVTVANAPVIIDGNGYTLTCKNSERAIEIPSEATNVNVTIKNLNLAIEGYCQRGINFNVTGGALTIDNVKISENGSVATYALNLPGSSDNAKVTIKDSYLRGNIALNVWGENMIINATNTELVSYDGTEVENYTAISLNNDGSTCANGTIVNVEGGKIVALDEKGELSYAVRNSTMTGDVTISASTEVVGTVANPVAVVLYEGYNEFYSCNTLQNAIDKAIETKGSVKLVKDITLEESVSIPAEKSVVIDLNGKTITGTMVKPNHVVMNYGTLTIKNGTISSTAGNGGSALCNKGTLTVENATINGSSICENNSWPSYPINNYGTMTVTNSTINGYHGAIACNDAGTTTVNNCTIIKNYLNLSSHVFYINHADAKVVVNGGTYTHKGKDGSLAYVNMGEITVNDGTFNAEGGGYGIASLTNGKVTIKGGTFNAGLLNWGGSIVITGGTFKTDPTAYLAEGYYATETNGVWVVAKQDWKDYVKKLNAGHNKNSSISVSTGADFLPIVAVNPTIYGYSVFENDTRITDKVIFRFRDVKEEDIDENSYKVSFNLAVLDENGNELEIKDGRMNPYDTSDPREHLNVYMNLIEVPADYAISQVKVGDTVLTLTQNASGNCATGEYWIGSDAKDLYFQSMTAGLIEVTVSKM